MREGGDGDRVGPDAEAVAAAEAGLLRGDLRWGSTVGVLRAAAERHPDRQAIVDGATTLTYAQLLDEVERIAGGLVALGVVPGDQVAIWAPNCWRWIVAAYASHAVRAAIVPINTRYRAREVEDLLSRTAPRVVFVQARFLGVDYASMLPRVDGMRRVAVDDGDVDVDVMVSWAQLRAMGSELDRGEVLRRTAELGADEVADVLFTSGTTGRSKGVIGTHGQALRGYLDWGTIAGFQSGDRYLIVNPFFHTFGYKAGWLLAAMFAATVYPMAVFDPDATLALVERHRITALPGPPTIYTSLLSHPGLADADVSSLRVAATGAANIPSSLVRAARRELGLTGLITAYGLTESTGCATMCRIGDDPDAIAHTSGRAVPSVEVRVVGSDDQPLPPRVPGEIQLRGYNVTRGYLDDPAATRELMTHDGWMRTGDVGTLSEAGYLAVTDRLKDMFIVGGFNAYPAEIENVLVEHDSILEAAVVGVPDDRLGEVARAYVVLRDGAALDANELIAWARTRMANYKVPRTVHVIERLPRNLAGKVLRKELRY